MTRDDSERDGIGRRDALKAGAMAAGGLAIGSVGSEKASAQVDEERLRLGSEWSLDDKDDGSLVLTNENSGATLEYDESAGEWALGSINTDSVSSNSVDTDEARITEGSAEIYQSSAQSVGSGSVTTVEFDTEDTRQTPGDVLTVDLANNKIVIEKAGRYTLDAAITYPSPGTGTRIFCRIDTPLSNVGADDNSTTGANSRTTASPGKTLEFSSDDVPVDVTVKTLQDSGGSLNTEGALRNCFLSVGKIG